MLKIGCIYRQSRKCMDPSVEEVDGLPNFYYETNVSGLGTAFNFQRGIHNVKRVSGPDGKSRCPLIIVSSSPHKAGSKTTPWQDKYDPDHGYIKYYGDNKQTGRKPEEPNNSILLELLQVYRSNDAMERLEKSIPIVFFERTTVDGRPKGNLIFQGYGILESAELVTQYDYEKQSNFANYLFNFCVFTLKNDQEQFDWSWIADRCNPELTTEETNKYAPFAWKQWIKQGSDKLHLFRRSVSVMGLIKEIDQKLDPKSEEYKLLNDIYHFYDNKKHNFEYLAMEVTRLVIEENGAMCTPGWITKKSGDGGIDYVLRIDIGQEKLSGIRIVVLGQAKCTVPNNKTNGVDIARTVARLKRGWVGAFVTTSFFSRAVQQEVNEDQYPIMLINGMKVSTIVKEVLFRTKMALNDYLVSLEEQYEIKNRIPDDILDI